VLTSFHSKITSGAAGAVWRSGRQFVFLASFAAVLSIVCPPARADFIPQPIRGGGTVDERGKVGTQVALQWTGKNGQGLGTTPIQRIGAAGFVRFVAPNRSPDVNGRPQLVYDYVQFSKDPDPVSWLSVEAFVPSGSDFLEYNVFDFIADSVGEGVTVRIPDLFGDTNGNGMLDSGDVLYAAVNLADYIPADVSFALGDTFNVTGGSTPALPGMIFGTAPITLDPSSPDGFSNPDPWTGTGTALTEHDNTAVPERGTNALIICGMLFFGFLNRSRIFADPVRFPLRASAARG
jgi:hypothetical protein